MTNLSLCDKSIGPDSPVLVIAEIGVNHDGSVERAIELVDIAAGCGADAVKLQVFDAERLLHRSCRLAAYQERSGAPRDPAEMLKKYQLSRTDLQLIVEHIRRRGLLPIATPFSPSDIPTIETLKLAAVKIASPDLVNRVLLRIAAKLSLPLLLSTGAATLSEMDETLGWLRDWKSQFALLHCVSSYPVAAGDANLAWIGELQDRYDVPVGYSDHTIDVCGGALAVAAGATFVERHLTYDCAARGPDHAASSDPAAFREYIRLIRLAQEMLGARGKCVLPCEQDVRAVSRQSLVLQRDVGAGRAIGPDDLTAQRPGTGISAGRIEEILGRRATRDLPAGSMLTWEMVGGETVRRTA